MEESSTSQPLSASKDRQDDGKATPALNVSPYVANILDSSVFGSLWTAIEENVSVTAAHRELASRRQSNDKQPYAAFLLNAPVQEGIPCIEQILTGDSTKEPCADLDHSARYKPAERFATGARVRTGCDFVDVSAHKGHALTFTLPLAFYSTPMFMACELSSSTTGLVYSDKSLKRLGRKLRAVEELGDGLVFKRAFPGDDSDGTFMEKFQLMLEAEEERIDSGVKVTTDPQTAHLPRHDIESVFWVLLWSLARARPEGAASSFEDGPFSKWANVMLQHTIGDESSRWFQLNAAWGLGAMLHADLEHFDTLIEDMAAYLVVPWARYKHVVDEDHVYVAIRRLLLAAIHALANDPSKDVRLDTMQLRCRA